MIDGLTIDITSKELEEHIRARAAHHRERSRWYQDQVVSLRSGGMYREAVSSDWISSLEQSAKRHHDKMALFQLVADRVVPNETYRLDESDLARLELLDRYYRHLCDAGLRTAGAYVGPPSTRLTQRGERLLRMLSLPRVAFVAGHSLIRSG